MSETESSYKGIKLCQVCIQKFPPPKWKYQPAFNRQPPTDADINLVFCRLVDINNDIEAHQKQVSWLTKTLATAERNLATMLTSKDSYMAILQSPYGLSRGNKKPTVNSSRHITLSVIKDVPQELWIEIFTLSSSSLNDICSMPELQTLSLVCRSWRNIIINSPSLWTGLRITSEYLGPRSPRPSQSVTPRLARFGVERSKTHSLSLELEAQPATYMLFAAIVDPVLDRIKHLFLSGTQIFLFFVRTFLSSLPNLESLQITDMPLVSTVNTVNRCLIPFNNPSSKLIFLNLKHVALSGTFPTLPTVRHLEMCGYGNQDIHSVLASCPGTVSLLIIDAVINYRPGGDRRLPPRLLSPELEELNFDGLIDSGRNDRETPLKILCCLIVPKLKSFSVQFFQKTKYDTHSRDLVIIEEFLLQSGWNLKRLSVTGSKWWMNAPSTASSIQLVKVQRLRRSLEVLHMTAISPNSNHMKSFIEEMTVSTLDKQPGEKLIFPHIRELILAVFDDQLKDTLNMLHSRATRCLKVVELMVYERNATDSGSDSEVTWLNKYVMNDPQVIASLAALRKKGLTVSCLSYPRFIYALPEYAEASSE